MRELYLNVSQHFRAGKLAEGLRRHSQKLRAVVVAMAMIFIAAPFYGQSWNLVDIADLTSTDVFMIVDTASGNAMTNDNGANSAPACVSLSFNADNSQVTTATIPDNVKWNISGDGTDGYIFYPNGTTETWLYCSTTANSGSNNNLRVGTGNRNLFLLSDAEIPYLITNDDYVTRYFGVYSNQDWRGYTSVSSNIASTRIAFYKYTANLNTVATPTITPNGGEFETTVDVTLVCETEDAAIYYTLDGETPTTESTLYAAPFTLTESATVKAIAVKEDMDNSAVTEATFTKVVSTVATPTITPNGGEFETTVDVTLACETADASIYYTLDGTDPTAESTPYNAPFTLSATTSVKAIAIKAGMNNSVIAEAIFTKLEPIVPVNYTRITSLDQLQDGDKVIIAARYDDDATHYYVAPTRIANNRFNGVAVDAENEIISTDVDSVVWTVMIADDMYKFVNASNDTLGYGTSGTAFTSASNKEWTIAEYTNVATALVSEYSGYKITNVGNTGRSVALNANNNVFGAYANSNAENTNAGLYNFALDFFVDLGDHAPLVATPTFSVPAGNYSSAQNVEILCATEGATIHYTLDGTDPTEESDVYETALTITEPTTVKAKAYKQDCIASGIAEAFYNVNTTPTITVDAETLNFENVNETKTVNVSSFNLTSDITVAVSENFSVDAETIPMNTEATLTVTFTGNAVTNGTLTLSSGETEVTVALVATPLVASEGAYFPVAEALADWTGDYIITYTDLIAETINALNGIHENNYGTAVNVFEFYEDGTIASNLTTEMCKVTVAPTEDGKYSMYLNRTGYLGLSSDGNKLYTNSTFTVERDEWTFSDNNGEIVITSVKYPNRNLKWNSGDPRFACYKNTSTTGDPLTLYKLGAIPAVATPVFTPAAGYYEEAQNVTITCATEGATIYYTIDGTAPTNESTQYTEPIALSQNTTIKAIAYLGEEFSFVATATYTFPVTAANVAELYALEGTEGNIALTGDVTFVYKNGKNIFVKDATGGLLVFDQNNKITTEYTEGDVISGGITGTISMYHGMLEFVPVFNTAASTQNTGAVDPTVITVEQLLSNEYVSQLVKVENVAVATGTTYTAGQVGSNVTFSQNGNEALLRNSFKTLDMTIADNTNWDITGFAAIYDDNIQIYPRGNSDLTEFVPVVPAEPTFSHETGTYYNDFELTLTCETEGATIYYTLDGSDPSDASTAYNAAIAITSTTTVKAIAILDGVQSEIVSATYTIETAVPVFTPPAGTYSVSVDVTLTCETQGATIYYNLNDTDTEVEYATPLTFTEPTTIYAFAEKNSVRSQTVSAIYTITSLPVVAMPTFEPNGGDFVGSVEVTLDCETEDAAIYYTTNGDEPTVADENLYNDSFTLTETTTVKAIAVKEGMATSNLAEATFTKLIPVATPTITPNGGEFVNTVDVTLACETEDAAIYYTTNGNEPTVAEGTLYDNNPFSLTESTTVKAIAVKDGMAPSELAEASFTILEQVATPTITPNGGNFEESVEVTLACETAGAAIHYTTDGTAPTAESTPYNAPFILDATTRVKAIAVKEGMADSEIAEANFTKVEPAVAINYTRITSLEQLQDGDKVIIASRYDNDASHYYVAPTRIANKLKGVAVNVENDVISTDVDTIVWTIKVNEGTYRFVNASNDTLGYSSSTNFSKTSNKDWTLSEYTTIASALVGEYTGYMITNATNTGRTIALSSANNNVFGAYANSNAENNNEAGQYNFALDFFVDLGDHAPLVATPTFSVPTGNYSSAQNVEILCATEGATIHYTLDGTDPTEESDVYETALTITEPTTVKAKAYKQDCIASGIAEAFYNVNTTPTITVDAEILNFENVNETKTVNVSSFNLTSDITVAVSENFSVDAESIPMNTDATLTVTFTGNAVTNGTLTLSSGETEVTVALVATPLVVSEGSYYPVAEALTDWTGDYLITFSDIANETINVLNGIHSNNYGTYENMFEYYTDGMIESNLTTEMCKVTVAPTEDGKYSMYMNRNGYLGLNSDGNKLYAYETFSETRDEWTFSENNGEIVITSVKYPNRNLKWNSGDPRFACYKNTSTTGEPLTLYKLGAVPTIATPVFTPAAGYYEDAQNVTITCATEGATIYYTTDGTTPTNESTQYTGAIAVSHNTTIKAIAYVGEEFSFVATARYTFPNFVENIAALYEIENTTETYILTGDVTFVYRNGKSIYVKDATGGLLVFDQNNKITTEYTEGDVISGGITGNISIYHGMLEFVPAFNTAASTQNTGAVAPTVITVEQLLSNAYVSQLVKVENVAVATGTTYTEGQIGSNVTFSQNGSEAILRNGFKTLDMEIGDNTNWDITGFAVFFDDAIQIYPRNNDDVTIITSVEELASEIAIYPNPTSDIVNIVTNGNAQRVELTNVDGQIVSSEEVASDMVTVSLEEQPAGMYFVRIYTADEVIVRKVTKF